MQKKDTILEIIKKRKSRRNYTAKKLTEEETKIFKHFFMENQRGPFLNKVRFKIVENNSDVVSGKSLGTYGMIRGARQFIVGAVECSYMCYEDYGYTMEKNIIEATRLGLDTCWIGITFKKNIFSEAIDLKSNEVLPAVSPIGRAAGRETLIESGVRFLASANKRKKGEELFFDEHEGIPLSPEKTGDYEDCLQAVRLGPSASNKQPWRIVKKQGRFDLYLKPSNRYKNPENPFNLQRLDMGIAMCHFELTAREKGLKGKWEILDNNEKAVNNALYIVSWLTK